MIKAGEKLPEVTFQQMCDGKPQNLSTSDVFSGKKVVVFAVPGAFTPTCSEKHLPGFVALCDKIKEKGVDTVACTAVNDAFIMDAWQKARGAENISMLADGSGQFAKAIGAAKDTGIFGGIRSNRYALVANDGVVEHVFVEEPGQFTVSSAEAVLEIL